MAGSRIKGITVEIGGDTTKLQTALKGVNSGIKNTQSQLKDVEKLLKPDPGNIKLLTQKQKLLSSAVSETKEKLATLKTAAEQANQALANGDISKEQYDALQWEIIETEEDLKKLEAQANQSATAVQKIATAGESLKSAGDKVSSAGEKFLPASAAVTALGVAAVKTASESADAMNYMTMAGWKTSDMLDGIEGIMTIAGAVNTVTGAIKGIGAATSGISAVLKVFSGIGLVIGGAITAVKNFINMFQNGFSVVKDILMGVGIAL